MDENITKLVAVIILLSASFWVNKDANSRGMNAKVWTVFILFFSILSLPIYFIFRKTKVESSNHIKNRENLKSLKSRINSKNKSMKVMSIIGIVFLSLCLLLMIVFFDEEPPDEEAAAGIAIWGLLYGMALAIVGVVSASKKTKSQITDFATELNKLAELKEKGIITEDEFNQQKTMITGI